MQQKRLTPLADDGVHTMEKFEDCPMFPVFSITKNEE